MNVELRVFIWQLREIWREIKNSQSLLKLCNQFNSVGSVLHILLYQERFLKLFDLRIWIILLSHTRNSRGLPFRMKIIRFFNFTIKAVILFVVTVLLYRINNRNMVESKAFYLTGLLPTIPMNSIGPSNDTLGDSVGSSNINRFVLSLLYRPKGKKISESSFLNPKESTPRTRTNWGLRWVIRNWIKKRGYSSEFKESSDQYFDSIRNKILPPERKEGEERSIFWDLFFLRAEIESNRLAKRLSDDSSMARQLAESDKQLITDMLPENMKFDDLAPEDIEKILGNPISNPTRSVQSFFYGGWSYDGWSELHMASKPTERSTRDPKLLKKEQDLSFIRRAEHQELVNLFKILMYLQKTVSIHPISSDAEWELEERFHEMADLFTLSITEPDLVYRKGFAFSMDSYGLDQKQFLNEVFNSRYEWKKKSLWVLLPPIFYEENESFLRNLLNPFFLLNRSDRNFEYGIQRDQIGKDTLNHRTLMKYTVNHHLSNLKKSQKRWFNPLILISRTQRSMNRDPDAYRYKWSTWIEKHFVFEQIVFDRLKIKIHMIDAVSKAKMGWFEILDAVSKAKMGWFEILDAVSKAKMGDFDILDAMLNEIIEAMFIKLPPFVLSLSKRLLKFSFFLIKSSFVSFGNAHLKRSPIYISELKGPKDQLRNQWLESIGLQVDHPEISQPSKFLSNEGSLCKKIPKRRIDPFDPRKNRRKSFDNTDSRFSRLFYDQDNWLNPVKPFHRSSLLSAFYKASRLRFLKNPHAFCFDCNKRFPFYVERVRSKNYDFLYGQFLNTFIGNKIFSLGVGKKKHPFWWRDTLSAIESEVSKIFSGDETDNLYKSSSQSDRAVYSIAGISGTPRTEGEVVNLEKTYCQSLSDMNLSDSKGKNLYNLYQSLNSNKYLIDTLCSEKYVPSKKKNRPSREDKRSLRLRKKAYQEKRKAWFKTYKKKKALATRKKWKRFKTYLPWVFTLQGYRYLQTIFLQILVAEFRRLKTENKYVAGFLHILSLFGDSIKVVVKRGRIKEKIRFFVIRWKNKSTLIRKIRAKINRIKRKISRIQRSHFRDLLRSQQDMDLQNNNNTAPLKPTHLNSENLREFFYATFFFLLVTGYLVCSQLGWVFWTSRELQKEFKTVKFILMEPSLLEIEMEQLLDRYPLSEKKSSRAGLTDILLDTLNKMLFPNVYGIRLNRKKYFMAKLVELIDLISFSIDQHTFWLNTRSISHTSKEIYSAIRAKRVWVDEKIPFWVENSEYVDDEERAVLMQFSTFTREKRIDQILWNLTDSDHFSKNEFDSQLTEQPGEIYLRRLIDLHNRGLLNYEFNTSCVAERQIFLAFYHTLTYSKTPSEAFSDDVQKPFSLRLALAPSRGILVIGSLGLGRSHLIKYLTKHSNFPVITIFLDKFRDTIFRIDEREEDDEGYDSDFDNFEIFIDSREDIEAINQDIRLCDNMDIDIDPRAEIFPDMDDHDDINAELETMMDGVDIEMDTIYDVAKFFTSLQIELTKAMAPCIILIPNIHELDFRDSGSFSLNLLVNLLSWDGERSSNNCESFSNRNSIVIASTHLPTEVHPALIAPHRFGTCIKIRRPLISQQQKHFFNLLATRGFRLDKKAFQAKGFAAINMGSHAQTLEALANEALAIAISQGKSIIDENTIRLARHRQTWQLRAHEIPVKNPRPVFYQIGRAIAQVFFLSNSPLEPISIFLQKKFGNSVDSYVYSSYYELGMSMKKLTILLYLLKCSAGAVAQELWAPPEPNENNRIAYGRLVEDDFDLLHGLLEIEGILEGFSRTDLEGVSRTEQDFSQTEKEGKASKKREKTEKRAKSLEKERKASKKREKTGKKGKRLEKKGVSRTEQDFSQTEKEGVSRTEQDFSQTEEGVSRTEQDFSQTEKEGVSRTEKDFSQTEQDFSQTEQDFSQTEQDFSQTEKEGVSRTEQDFSQTEEGVSRTEQDFSQTEKEGVSRTEKDFSQTEQDFSQTEQDFSQTEQDFSQTEKEGKASKKREKTEKRAKSLEKERKASKKREKTGKKGKRLEKEGVSRTEKEFSQTEKDFSQTEKDCSQFDKDRVRVLLRPEPRNPAAMLQNGFSSMFDKKFTYKSSDVYVGGLKVDPQKFFSNFIAWSPRIWSPWGFLFDWVERVNDNELGFPYWCCSFWAKHMDIDIVGKDFSDEFDEDYKENDSDSNENEYEAQLKPYPLEKRKKERALYYKLDDQDDGFEPDENMYNYEVGDKFYEAFLRIVYKTRAKIRFSKEQVLFRVSQFIWHPGNPFVFISDDPALASIFSHREFFVETDEQVLKWYVTAEIKSMKKSWLFEEAQDAHFDWLTSRKRWLRRIDPSLSKASFRSNTLSESFQYLSNLFLSNRTLVEQMHKTLVRKRWLFPDDMQIFFQNFFREHSATAETRKD
uniref:Hypothetical chloroplast RF2 n=1 Tax=Monopsis flava TaxID=2041137 RepID=A0A291F1G4_9ASTR|nr:hypothetical chloroplast RF2 [Monopsis flava]YP_009435910.1 hypothetical chloroplast RF2 [Monopsis flava]ATG25976.1 hypothetical chloroplast RF2 [Monopsis flava]ATG26001.1 hypothetical chloroplast RF2 [Monopsis flava]